MNNNCDELGSTTSFLILQMTSYGHWSIQKIIVNNNKSLLHSSIPIYTCPSLKYVENRVTWCLTENQLTENQLTENQLTEKQLTENQLTENHLTDKLENQQQPVSRLFVYIIRRVDRSLFCFTRSILSKLQVSRKKLYKDYIYLGCM